MRAIQLAKAALYAGVRLLMDKLEIDELDEIRLAGAFGSQIDPVHAMILGLIPDCDLAHVRSAGNAAGTGALIALLSGAARTEIEGVVRRVEKIETAVEPRFQEHFVEAMAFPHKTAAFPHLGAVVPLPARTATTGAAGADGPRRTTTPAHRGDRHEGGHLMDDPQRRRSGGRAARQALRLASHAEHVPYLTRTLAPFEVLGEEGLSLIEHNADTILEEVGVEFRGDPEALTPPPRCRRRRRRRPRPLPARACAVRSSRPPRRASSPSTRATRSATSRSAAMHTVFAPNYGSPFVRDLDNGRRYGTIEDFRNFVKLTYASPYLHHSGGTVCEPVDVPVNKRHLDMVYSHIRYSDKPFMGSVTAPERARDTVEMARLDLRRRLPRGPHGDHCR